MNSPRSFDDTSADERASHWAARLDGENLTPAAQAELDQWLTEHPDNRERLAAFCQLSAELEQTLPMLAATGGVDLPSEIIPAAKWPRKRIRWMAGAVTAAAAALAMVLWLHEPGTQWENLATPSGSRESITLVDGTVIDLNAQTALEIAISPEERRVRLANGEAFFDVEKDPIRPFIVETPAGSVQVTGTRFALRSESAHRVEVLVQEGSVEVRPEESVAGRPAARLSLIAGDLLIAAEGSTTVTSLSPDAIAEALAWREGQIVFSGTPLRAAVERFGRYHGRGITTTEAASELLLGGRYRLDDLDGFLAALEAALPVRVSRSLSGTTRVSLRTEP